MKNNLLTVSIISVAINLVLGSYLVKERMKPPAGKAEAVKQASAEPEKSNEEVNPASGYQVSVKYGKLGPKMISMGVIDEKKFRDAYERAGQSLTGEQEEILLEGSGDKIKITRDNSYFLLNFFWAVGLANKTRILDEGEMTQYGGKEEVGNFASTGGWTLGKGEAMKYYSKGNLIALDEEQEALVEEVASNIFRPCCNNSTAFPDCNHGMALLGLLELMAANGALEDEMYEAAKYFNAFWFPGNYYDLALYFKNDKNLSFAQIDARTLLSKQYSSASGAQNIKKWLVEKGLQQQPPKSGGGCGV